MTAMVEGSTFEKDTEALGEQIYRFAVSRGLGVHEALDVVQETLLRAFRKRADLREPALFRGWVFGIARNIARSSSAICDGPSSPMETPQWDPTHLMLAIEMAPIRRWSIARPKNAPNGEAKGTLPHLQSPTEKPTRFCSAMNPSKNRSG